MVETKKDDYIKLAEKVLDDSDKFFVKYSSESGDLLIDKDSLRDISMIIKEGLAISNHIVENNLYSDDTYMQELLSKVTKEAGTLAITEENAKKLNFRDALIHWSKLHALIITLCSEILEKNK